MSWFIDDHGAADESSPRIVAEEAFYTPRRFPLAATLDMVTPFALLQASLGLEFDPHMMEARLRNPRIWRG